jgi:ketosteroid isomerase-like protein
MLQTLLAAALVLPSPVPSPAPTPDVPPAVAAEVEKGVKAYNAHDTAYYESALSNDAVYIAEDGAVFAGKERVLRLFTRIFGMTPSRQLAVAELAGGTRGDVAWARFKWTLTMGPDSRHGVSSILFVRAGDAWQVLQIQNTPAGHAMPAAPGSAPHPPSPRP